ncbi:7613_t:CDS:2, partial [Acaulospora morrowiae]
VKARIYYDQQKLVIRYDGKKIKIPIMNNKAKKIPNIEHDGNDKAKRKPNTEPDSNESTDKDDAEKIFDEIVYEKEEVKEKEGYYTGESHSDSDPNDKVQLKEPEVMEELPAEEDGVM